MNHDIVQSPGVEQSAAYLTAIIYPLIMIRYPCLGQVLQLEEGKRIVVMFLYHQGDSGGVSRQAQVK